MKPRNIRDLVREQFFKKVLVVRRNVCESDPHADIGSAVHYLAKGCYKRFERQTPLTLNSGDTL